jgi:hypothetical protein
MAESSKPTSAAAAARRAVVAALKDDHKHALRAFREFDKLVPEGGPEAIRALVARTLALLELHAALEAEVFYPVARAVPALADAIDEAEVEHASMKALMELLKMRTTGPADPKYIARFRVLGEYVRHHVQEEETLLLAGLERAPIAWEDLAARLAALREELARAHPLALEALAKAARGAGARAARAPKSPAARKTAAAKETPARASRSARTS